MTLNFVLCAQHTIIVHTAQSVLDNSSAGVLVVGLLIVLVCVILSNSTILLIILSNPCCHCYNSNR